MKKGEHKSTENKIFTMNWVALPKIKAEKIRTCVKPLNEVIN